MDDEAKIAELRAIIEGIKDRVKTQYPSSSVMLDEEAAAPISVPLADLMPLVHARDAAQAKMAALGSVNPRPGGMANDAIQFVKRAVARGLGWFVRDQITFNRGAIACVEATIEALSEVNRSVVSLAGSVGASLQQSRGAVESRIQTLDGLTSQVAELRRTLEAREIKWRLVTEDLHRISRERILANERSYSDLLKAQHAEFSQALRAQHAEFTNSLAKAATEMQDQFGRDLAHTKLNYERLIHNELRVVRQRGASAEAQAAPAQHSGMNLDYQSFSQRFRGSEEHVKTNQAFYVEPFRGAGEVLDLGCGEGEFLEVMRTAGIRARGIDQSPVAVANCQAKGLAAEQADMFAYLSNLGDYSLDAIFSSQVVEHLASDQLPEMIRLCASKLRRGGLIAIETPNPQSLAIFATHFYIDPTHVRPVPSALLAFYLEENGMGGIEVQTRFPAVDSFPELNEVPEGFRNRFFGGLDYVIFARKL